jgi:hypothetical protein
VRDRLLRCQSKPPLFLPAIACGIGFALFLGFTGIPVLRHDWSWIAGPGFFSNAWSVFSGWRSDGFGAPRPYPTDYLLTTVNFAIVGMLGNYLGYLVNVFAIGFTAAYGAMRLAARFSASSAAALAAAIFATFNPWTYNEVVAGHIYMVLAYGAAMLLASELLAERPSSFKLGAYALLTMGQLQFFLPSLLALAGWCLATRRNWASIGIVLFASLPIWIGLAAERGSLRAIQYTLTWQISQSVDPLKALALGGYFARYADALPPFAPAAVWAVAACAAAGAVAALIRAPKRAAWPVVGVLALWAFVSGTKGWFGAAYVWLVRHVVATGVYRELYDAVGFIAIAYVAGSALASRRIEIVRWLWLGAAALSLSAWMLVPPARYWVPAWMLPPVHVAAPANTRYALMPPLQPVVFRWGAGLDPDAVVLPGNVTPLNTQQFSDPESPALMRYALTGDPRGLQALSVSEVIERPAFATDVNALRYQLALPPPTPHSKRMQNSMLDPLPELTLAPLPGLSDAPQPLWKNAIFFGDAHGVRGRGVPGSWSSAPAVHVITPSSPAVAAKNGWVDARSAFVALPRLSQGLGGAITTDPGALLAVDPAQWTLAYVAGALQTQDGTVLARSTRGYAWLPPLGVTAVRCLGMCIVVAQTSRLPAHALGARRAPAASRDDAGRGCHAAPAFTLLASWLAISSLPASPRCLLRYNVRFDPHWSAWLGGVRLAHVAVDSAANGWVVPAHSGDQRLVVVELAAAVQFAVQALAIALLIVLGAFRIGTSIQERARRAA